MRWQDRPGTIGIAAAYLSRYTAFHECLAALEKPAGTVVHFQTGSTIARQRERLAERMVGDWLMFVDDDHVFSPDTLMRLLAHFEDDRVDAVVPLCLKRLPPFAPVMLAFNQDFSRSADVTIGPHERGLVEIGAAGGGGMVIRRRVFERLSKPWFALGQFKRDGLGEDLYFCRQLHQAGCRLFCDVDLPIGHIAPVALWPSRATGFQVSWIGSGVTNVNASASIVREYAAGHNGRGEQAIAGERVRTDAWRAK